MDHRIAVLGDKSKVEPGVAIVGKDDFVVFETHDTAVRINFPEDRCPFSRSTVSVPKDAKSEPLIVVAAAGVYPYSVWCLGPPGRSAQGNSDPIIIIKR